ncbi:hypothetical protein BY458DRAFT_560004 [Sporodiniella umbellata]|nr:hypothetical protein BY458DRAFT_560004 [Sporodiniella umbellata]
MSEHNSAKDLGKNKLTLSSVRPLSILIPPSWSASSLLPSSQHSTQLSALSLDQLSSYAKKISNVTLNPFGLSSSSSSSSNSLTKQTNAEQKKSAFKAKTNQAINGFLRVFLLSLNDTSLKLYTVSEHIQRKVTRQIELKKKIRQLSEKVEIANLDIEDAQRSVRQIENIESFINISNMIKSSLDIIKLIKSS